MRYHEFSPPRDLAPWVKCAWVFASEREQRAPERIVPDGRPELIVHAGAPFAELTATGSFRRQPRTLLAGQLTAPLQLRATGAALVVGIRFHPDGAREFLGRPMREALDRRIDLEAIAPGAARRLPREVAAQTGDEARAGIVFEHVRARLAAAPRVPDAIVRAAVTMLEANPEVTVEQLLAVAGVGRRQLERRFADAVGIGAALLGSILRFRRAFDVLERDGTRPWTEAALAAGYYDQSHFIREFHRFVGCRPSEFFRPQEGLAEALAAPAA